MLLFGLYYVRWHYTYALKDLTGIILNFLWFFYNFFSIPLLVSTLFVPFHRLNEVSGKKLDLSAWAQAFVINMLMRIVGMLLRITIIVLGLVFLILTVVVGAAFFLVWLAAPLFVVTLVGFALTFLAIG